MGQTSRPWDSTVVGDAGPYSSNQWADFWAETLAGILTDQANQGVNLYSGNNLNPPLQVDVTTPASSQVQVYPGSALVRGRFYVLDSTELITISANVSADDRIDRIVLRTTYANQEVRIFTIEGTPDPAPTAPALVQTAAVYDIPLAQVLVPSGFLTISSGITDEREPSILWGTEYGGVGISSQKNPYSVGDILVATGAKIFTALAVGAAQGMKLVVDSTQPGGIKWIDPRPSLVSRNDGGALVTINNTNLIFTAINSDPAGNVASISGSNELVMNPGVYKVKGGLSYSWNSAVASADAQLELYNNAAAAAKTDVSGNNVRSNSGPLINGQTGGSSVFFPEQTIQFTGAETLQYRILTGFGTNSQMRRLRNPFISLERVY